MPEVEPPPWWHALPRSLASAGLLLRDGEERVLVLVLRPSYRTGWLLPGGVLEDGESPGSAAAREAREELDLQVTPGRLLCVDHRSARAERPASLQFVFDGGVLGAAEIEAIAPADGEILEAVFLPPDQALPLFEPGARERLAACLAALRDGTTVYLEDGRPPRPG